MNSHFLILASLVAFSFPAAAQTSATPARSKAYAPPKTPWGEPDLQGNWPAQFNIPRSRPDNVKGAALSDEEFTQREAQTEQQFQSRQSPSTNRGVTIGPPSNFSEIGKIHKQTSLVIDPPDGKMQP